MYCIKHITSLLSEVEYKLKNIYKTTKFSQKC